MTAPPVIHRCFTAGLAGLSATVPMTAYMEWVDRARITDPGSTLPPREIVEEAAVEAGHQPSDSELHLATLVAHYGYGTAVAAIYGLQQKRGTLFSEVISGAMYGLQVWGFSYLGLLPALGSGSRATNQSRRTNEVMIVAHLIWGASLGLFYFTLQAQRPSKFAE